MTNVGFATLSIIPSARGFASALRGQTSGPVDKVGKESGNRFGTAFKAAAVAGVGLAAAAVAKGFSDALGRGANDDLIAARLGIPEAEAARLGDIAGRVYADAWGDSLGGVTNSVTAISSSFDNLDDSQIEKLTARAEALGQVFELDVAEGIQAASELVSSGLAGSGEEAFDLLTRGLQEMPQGIRDELIAASNEYGDFFADLGLSGEESFAALTRYAEGGVYGIDKFGDALKELTIRGSDMSTASVAAYEAAGLSAEEMSAMFLAGGDDAHQALETTAQALLGIEDPTERANAAIALFGTPLEDLSVSEIPGFLEGLTDMSGGLGDVEGAAQQMADQVSGNTATKLESFRRKALAKLADFAEKKLIPVFESAVEWFEDNWPAIQAQIQSTIEWLEVNAWPVIQTIFNGIVDVMTEVVAWVEENWPQIEAVISGVMTTIGDIIETALAAAQIAWEYFGDNVVSFLQGIVEPIQTIIGGVIDIIQGLVDFVVGVFTGDWGRAWDGIKSIFTGTVDAVIGYAQYLWEMLKLYVTSAIDAVKLVWDFSFLSDVVGGAIDAVVGFFTALPGRFVDLLEDIGGAAADIGGAIIGGVVGGIGDLGGALLGLFKDGWDAVAGWWNDGPGTWSFSIPGWVPFVGGKSWNMPNIPTFGGSSSSWNPWSLLPEFHSGGPVGALGGPARDVPAMLQTGEYVLSRDDVDNILRGRGNRQQGPLIENVYVTDGRDLNRELRRAQALQAAIA